MSNSFTVELDKKKDDAEIVEIKDPVVRRVQNALVRLHSLKNHRLGKYWKYREEYAQRLPATKTEDGFTNYQMNTGFAIVNSKSADILTNTPKYDFIALDDEAKTLKRVREIHWQYVWLTSGTDKQIVKIIRDALKYGVGFGEEVIIEKCRKARVPTITSENTIVYEEKEVEEYKGCKLNHLPYSQVYLNGTSIENTTEAIVISYWDRDEFLLTFGNDAMYKGVVDENIPKGKYYYIPQGSSDLVIGTPVASTSKSQNTIETMNTVSVLTYYNKYRDEYIILANNVWINPVQNTNGNGENQNSIQPIPYPHKEIPILVYTDHELDDDIYGMGEYDITESSRKLKDDIRSLHIEGIKAQGGIITIDPMSEFDDTVMKLGLRQYARVEKDAFGFFKPDVNLNSLAGLEQKVEEDLIVETGVDFKSQLFGPTETSARTKGRIAAAKKRINQNIKENAYNFYERLARLRSANIEFYYSSKLMKIPVKNMEINDDGSVEHVQNGYGSFTMKPEYFKGKIALIPSLDSFNGETTEDKKQKYIETLQIFLNMRSKDGSPLFDPKLLVEAGRGIIDGAIDIDKVLGKSPDSKSADELLKEAGIDGMEQPMDGGIPPEQQSGAPILLGSSPKQ